MKLQPFFSLAYSAVSCFNGEGVGYDYKKAEE
jgi:hypothetical protein